MTQTNERRALGSNRIVVPVLALAAFGGWSALAYSVLSSAELEKQLRGQVASLQEYQVRYLSERKQHLQEQRKAEEAAAELAQLREQFSATRVKLERLSESHGEIEAELTRARAQLQTVRNSRHAQGETVEAISVHITPRLTKRDVAAAQKVLAELGYASLEADGIVGPATRQAIEDYQRATGLPVTGELHAETLQALLHAAKVIAAQGEQGRKTF